MTSMAKQCCTKCGGEYDDKQPGGYVHMCPGEVAVRSSKAGLDVNGRPLSVLVPLSKALTMGAAIEKAAELGKPEFTALARPGDGFVEAPE